MAESPKDKPNIGKYTLPDIRLLAAITVFVFGGALTTYFIVTVTHSVTVVGQIDVTLIYGAFIGCMVTLLAFLTGKQNARKEL